MELVLNLPPNPDAALGIMHSALFITEKHFMDRVSGASPAMADYEGVDFTKHDRQEPVVAQVTKKRMVVDARFDCPYCGEGVAVRVETEV